MPGPTSETRGRFCGGLGGTIAVRYFIGPVITLYGRNALREYVDRLSNQVHPMIQTLFLNNDAVFHDDSAPIHTVETFQSWIEKHESDLQHLFLPAQ
jgi:hypothetical protein